MDEIETNQHLPQAKKRYKLPLLGVLFSVIGVGGVMVFQSPGRGGPVIVLVFLLLIFIFSLCTILVLIPFCASLLNQQPVGPSRLLYTAVALAAAVVFLVGLQTLGQLQVIDVCLVVAFELLLNFYLLRRF